MDLSNPSRTDFDCDEFSRDSCADGLLSERLSGRPIATLAPVFGSGGVVRASESASMRPCIYVTDGPKVSVYSTCSATSSDAAFAVCQVTKKITSRVSLSFFYKCVIPT